MPPETCPCCYEEDMYYFDSGEFESDGMQVGPATGICEACGYGYSQHVDHPESEQIEKHRLRCVEKMHHNLKAMWWLSKILTKLTAGAGAKRMYWITTALKNTAENGDSK